MIGRPPRTSGDIAVRLASLLLGLGYVWYVSAGAGAVGAGGTPTGAETLLVAVAVVAAVGASALLAATLTTLLARAVSGSSASRPGEAAPGLRAAITQTRPDAPGRPQPRAPGRAPAVV